MTRHESLGVSVPTGLGWRLALGAPIVLISVIGGRIIPSFTRNWLFKRKSPRLPSPQDMLDTTAVASLAAALIRVSVSWHTEFMTILLLVAGACWIAAFGLFELVYGPMLLTRRPKS